MKKFFVFLLSLLIIITFYVKVYAVIPSGYTAVSFLNGGNNFIYSDNPESFSVTPQRSFLSMGCFFKHYAQRCGDVPYFIQWLELKQQTYGWNCYS